MEKTCYIGSEQGMLKLGKQFAPLLTPGDVIFLQGDLGAGKTTLSRGILMGLGFHGRVKSPTYTIVEPYQLDHLTLFHFDLYRIQSPQELCDIGFSDYLTENAIILVEWPEKASVLLGQSTLLCQINFKDPGRVIQFETLTERGEQLLQRIDC